MDRIEHVKPTFPDNAFAGTAPYYARYRVAYPDRLLADLLRRSRITGKGRLLDLACGPGRVALAIAHSFQEVWAIDLEPEMIVVGRGEAARKGIENVKWMIGRAENLEAPPDSFDLITIGEAFHRLDQQIVASQSFRWLRPGGCLASMGSHSVLSGEGPWQQIVKETVRRGRSRIPDGNDSPKGPASDPAHNEQVFREAGFVDVASHPFVEVQEWTIETILGYLYSTSASSKAVLGDHVGDFESDLKAALLSHDPSGIYREKAQWGYTIGRKPD